MLLLSSQNKTESQFLDILNHDKIRIGDPCSHCKKGRMELHCSTKGVKLGGKFALTIFWKCDNQECMFTLHQV
ncbi:hypothetical protein DYY67_2070 [Candidatus Nitrosotalea sp. TS]|nr:hypothetical protein [Candidatus Nitrosotalea sp. TS]